MEEKLLSTEGPAPYDDLISTYDYKYQKEISIQKFVITYLESSLNSVCNPTDNLNTILKLLLIYKHCFYFLLFRPFFVKMNAQLYQNLYPVR